MTSRTIRSAETTSEDTITAVSGKTAFAATRAIEDRPFKPKATKRTNKKRKANRKRKSKK